MTATPPRLYLLDVEGTIAPITFVSEKLCPYARAHFEPFLKTGIADLEKDHASHEQSLAEGGFLWDLAMLQIENCAEQDLDTPRLMLPNLAGDAKNVVASLSVAVPIVLRYIYWLMDRDRKSTALKSLQGKIWKAGFESGELKGTLFPDVLPALTRWTAHGRVAIYSSGSAGAQQLLFRHSIYGDLTHLIAGYFDTRIGAKTESVSYGAIAAAMRVAPREVCFFSDVVRELDPARQAGMETRLVVRDGNAPIGDRCGHVAFNSFETTP